MIKRYEIYENNELEVYPNRVEHANESEDGYWVCYDDISTELDNTGYVFAVRYAIKRTTGAPYAIVRLLKKNWNLINDAVKEQIKEEIKQDSINLDEWSEILNLK